MNTWDVATLNWDTLPSVNHTPDFETLYDKKKVKYLINIMLSTCWKYNIFYMLGEIKYFKKLIVPVSSWFFLDYRCVY